MNQTVKRKSYIASAMSVYFLALCLSGCGNKKTNEIKMQKNVVYNIKTIPHPKFNFKNGSFALSDIQKKNIAETGEFLKNNPEVFVVIKGFASSKGLASTNMALSLNRAEAIKNELVKDHAFLENRIRIEAMGANESSKFKSDVKARCAIIEIDRHSTTLSRSEHHKS